MGEPIAPGAFCSNGINLHFEALRVGVEMKGIRFTEYHSSLLGARQDRNVRWKLNLVATSRDGKADETEVNTAMRGSSS